MRRSIPAARRSTRGSSTARLSTKASAGNEAYPFEALLARWSSFAPPTYRVELLQIYDARVEAAIPTVYDARTFVPDPMRRYCSAFLCALISLLQAATVAAGPAHAQVLCIGSNGHVAIECVKAQAACCCRDALTARQAAQIVDASCIDIPIAGVVKVVEARTTIDVKSLHRPLPAPMSDGSILVAWSPTAGVPGVIGRPEPPPAHSAVQSSIATVILLV
jgi:hypothetical protein